MSSAASTIYIFSGLGADKRVFQYMDFKGLDVHFVDWITPLKNEAINNYAARIAQQITLPNPF